MGENISQIHNIVRDQYFEKMVFQILRACESRDFSLYPFIELANHVISRLNTNPDTSICLCRNNPVITYCSSRPDRKLDRGRCAFQESRSARENFCWQSYERRAKSSSCLGDWVIVLFWVQKSLARDWYDRLRWFCWRWTLWYEHHLPCLHLPNRAYHARNTLSWQRPPWHSASRSSITLASESKRRLDNFPLRPYGSKGQKVDNTSSTLQCAS